MICIGAVIARSLVLVAVLALAAGCNGKADDGPAATIPPSAPTTSAPADPYAVPAVIDEAYVNRVLAALDQVEGDATRSIVAAGGLVPDAGAKLRSIYNDPQLEQQLNLLTKTDLGRLKMPPGNRKTAVRRLVQARPTCILVDVTLDFSDLVNNPPVRPLDEVDFLTLRPTQPQADPLEVNPTPWSVSNEEVLKSGALPRPENQCDA